MALEDALKDNTAAIRKLIAILEGRSTGEVITQIPETPAAAQGKEIPAINVASSKDTAVSKGPTLKYDDIKRPFLKLAQKDHAVATKLLGELGVKSLLEFESQPERFEEILAKVNAKLEG